MNDRNAQLESNVANALREAPRPTLAAETTGPQAGRRRDPNLVILSIERIVPDEDQVRREGKDADDPALRELAESIRSEGILQPLSVRYLADADRFELIAGERRYIAAKLVGLTEVPVRVVDADDRQAKRIQLAENIHRRDLSALELGAALQSMVDEGHTPAEVAEMIHKSTAYVRQCLTVVQRLTPEAKAVAERTPLSILYEAAQLPADQQVALVQEAEAGRLTRSEVRQRAVAGKRQAKAQRGESRGRPSKSKPYTKTLHTDNHAKVTITFRKSRVTRQELSEALRQALAQATEPSGKAA